MNVKVYSDISARGEQILFDTAGQQRQPFTAEGVKDLFTTNANEEEFRFHIHCNGGSTREGFVIYDIMRTSGKRIYCNIDGSCHSMAVIILLAAPLENRSANPNATALIHDVYTNAGLISAGQAQELANGLKRERNRILNIYADRTGYDRSTLESIMLEEKERTAQELLEWGFISRINSYTNKKETSMSNKKRNLFNVLNDIKRFLRGDVNYDFTDADGNLLFTTEKEDDSLEVGDIATPDGTFELADGRVVTVADGVITEVTEPEEEEVQNLHLQVEALNKRLQNAENLLRDAQRTIGKLANVRSTVSIKPRVGTAGRAGKHNAALSAEERKAVVKSNLKK